MARRAVMLALALVVWLPAWGCGSSGEAAPSPTADDRPVIRLGTKNFTEQFILGEIYAQALRARNFRVEVKRDLGSSELVDRALIGGGIDLYAEYTGVIVQEIARQRRRPRSAAETYRRAKAVEGRRGVAGLDMSPGVDRPAHAGNAATA